MSFPSEGRGHKFESCRARQRINGLPGPSADRASPSYPVATKLSNEATFPLANNHREFMLDLRERV